MRTKHLVSLGLIARHHDRFRRGWRAGAERRCDQRDRDLHRHAAQDAAHRHGEGALLRRPAPQPGDDRERRHRAGQHGPMGGGLHLGWGSACPGSGHARALRPERLRVHPARRRDAGGAALEIYNDDQTSHNIHPLAKVNPEWNKSQPPGSPPIKATYDEAGIHPREVQRASVDARLFRGLGHLALRRDRERRHLQPEGAAAGEIHRHRVARAASGPRVRRSPCPERSRRPPTSSSRRRPTKQRRARSP